MMLLHNISFQEKNDDSFFLNTACNVALTVCTIAMQNNKPLNSFKVLLNIKRHTQGPIDSTNASNLFYCTLHVHLKTFSKE